MPELPETETIARDLADLLVGRTVQKVAVLRPDVLRGATPTCFERRQSGAQVLRVWRRSKTVVLSLSGPAHVLVTPRFTGSLQFESPPDAYVTISWRFADGATLIYRDVRRLGTVALVDADGLAAFDQALGVEPLSPSFTVAALSGILRASRSAVKKVLMDQRRIAGVGNIYANEALHRAGIDPSRIGAAIRAPDAERLHFELRAVLEAGIAARGTTFRDYRDARNQRGSFAASLQAYGRGGLPCIQCGARLTETHAIDGRSTVFCHRCQR
ncbi:MAG: bifunctional DNA-formamidopyrimidine glycosylase/DNA-(apurinic or apyrimidinic site) lyase [Gemmatimonadaceae bacterium]|nr:bifunctional DNA-formamidopyrimidine glycosylase/DNA-(apurinic or apyrimidinic site) lyase [Gemmatimonadaceae bacterium]